METCLNEYYHLYKSRDFGNDFSDNFGKDGVREMMKIRLTKLINLGYEINIYQNT